MHWKQYISRVLSQDSQVDFFDEIAVRESFLDKFVELMRTTSDSVLANYLFWRVAQFSASFLSEEVRNMKYNFEKVTTASRWKKCVEVVSNALPISVGAMYAREHFPKKTKIKITELTNDIIEAFKKNLYEVFTIDRIFITEHE